MWRSKILTRRSYLKNWKMEKVSLDVFREEEPMEKSFSGGIKDEHLPLMVKKTLVLGYNKWQEMKFFKLLFIFCLSVSFNSVFHCFKKFAQQVINVISHK